MSIAAMFLQGAIGGTLLIVIFFVLIGGGMLAVVVSGRAAGGQEQSGERPGRTLIPGRLLCVVGLGTAVAGALFVSVATDVMGIILGATGYYLGARVFGVVVIVFSTITFFLGLAFGIDPIPGSYDEALSGLSRSFEK